MSDGQPRPWCIIRLGAIHEKSQVVARFFNRSDAEDYLRVLGRFLRLKGEEVLSSFVVCFDTHSLLLPDKWHPYMSYQIQIIYVGDGFTSFLKTSDERVIPLSSVWCDTEQQAFQESCRVVDKRVSRLLTH